MLVGTGSYFCLRWRGGRGLFEVVGKCTLITTVPSPTGLGKLHPRGLDGAGGRWGLQLGVLREFWFLWRTRLATPPPPPSSLPWVSTSGNTQEDGEREKRGKGWGEDPNHRTARMPSHLYCKLSGFAVCMSHLRLRRRSQIFPSRSPSFSHPHRLVLHGLFYASLQNNKETVQWSRDLSS